MRIVITGGTGFLGRRLLEDMARRGHDLVALVRSTSDVTAIAGLGQAVGITRYSDLAEVPALVREASPEIVIHTACSYCRAGESPLEIIHSNYVYGCTVLAGIEARNATFINVDTPLKPETGPYALTKNQFRIAMAAFYAGKIRLVNAVLHTMYGPADSPTKFTTHIIREFLRAAPALNMTPGEQIRDFIYIDDVVCAFRMIAEAAGALPVTAQFEVGSGAGIPLRRYVDIAKLETGAQTEVQAVLKYRESELIPMTADVTALTRLGWHPKVSLEDGIRRTVSDERELLLNAGPSPVTRS